MKLTPLDVRHKEFKRGMRGYADDEVDEFLDEVADEFERIFKENIDLSERVEGLEERIAHYHMLEETLQKTLVSAQQSAEELKANATKEAQLILRDAELKARQMVNDSYVDKQRMEKNVVVLKNAQEEFRFKFRGLLEGYMKQLTELDQGAKARTSEFAKQAAAIKEAIARQDVPQIVAAEAPPANEPQAAQASGPELAQASGPELVAAPAKAPLTALDKAASPLAAEPLVPPEAPVEESEPLSLPQAPESDSGPLADIQQETVAVPAASEAEDSPDPADDDVHILFAERDDFLADVDAGINENEFKW
jgi:cell division initiation protein